MIKIKNALALVSMLLLIIGLNAQLPDFVWALQGGNSSITEGNIQVRNTNNGIIAGGDFIDIAQFGQEEIVSNGFSDIFLASIDEYGELIQIQSFGSENEELLKFMELDSEGNIIIAIMFTDFITIGGNDYISLGGQDILLIKFNPDFSIQWVQQYGTELTDYVRGMSIDEDDNILVIGKFKNEINFDDISLTSMGSTDIYIAKYNPAGEVVNALSEGGSSYEDANPITAGTNGDFFISGIFYEETIVNGETISTENPTGIYFAKYNSACEFQWVEVINGTHLLPSVFLTMNTDGSIYIAGSFQEEVVFGSQTLSTEEFDADVYIAKYSTDGEALWAGHGNSNAGDVVTALSSDIGGNVYLAGHFLDAIDFNGIILEYTLC